MKKLFVLATVAVFIAVGFGSFASASGSGTSTYPSMVQASASKKGSMIIFPKIDVQVALDVGGKWKDIKFDRDSYVVIGNDGEKDVTLECIWSYPKLTKEKKNPPVDNTTGWKQSCCGTQNFTLKLTPNQVRYFSAGTGFADILGSSLFSSVNALPTESAGLASLVCFAVDPKTMLPIRYNNIYGNVTNVQWNLTDNSQHGPFTSWGYNAYAFAADAPVQYETTGPNGEFVTLKLTGQTGGYDACPNRLAFNFIAKQTKDLLDSKIPAVMGTDLTLVPCSADLREFGAASDPITPVKTLAVFSIWNQREEKLSGTQACVKCFFEQVLGSYAEDGQPSDAFAFDAADNFNFWPQWGGLGTAFGRARVDGKALETATCTGTKATGLLGVAYDFLDWHGDKNDESDGIPEMTSGRVLTGSGGTQPGGDRIRYSREK